MNFELREFAQATKEAEALLSQITPIELRAAALLLAGEAAYYARDYEASANWFRKFLSESPSNPQVKDAVLSLGWAELRRGKEAAARQIFTDFARDFASDTAAPDALMLSAELAESAGDIAAAQQQYDRMRVGYSGHPRHSLALLDGAILMMRTDRVSNAIATLQDFLKAAPDSPQAPRARTALAVARLATGAPAQAEQEITAALQGSDDPVTHLAAGVAAIELSKWDAAEKQLALARDSGSPAVVERAEAALTVMAFRRGQKDQFRQLANGIVAAGRPTAPLLYALADAETQDKSWDAALQTTKRLVTTFPDDVSADDSLARLGLAAVAERRWAVGSEALSLLRSKYPRSEFLDVTLLPAMEALIEIGAPAAASGPLQAFVTGLPNDPRATEAYLLLARARDATGDARGALAAYDGAEKSARGKTLGTETMLKHVRLLVQDRRWDVARPRLKNLIRSDEKTPEGRNAIAEASYYMGQDQSSQNDPLGAVEYLMTAGYLAPDSTYGQKALLAAGQEFARMRDPEAKAMAISVYDRLLGQPNLPLEVQQAARTARDALAAK
jgi:TolA-binding protein